MIILELDALSFNPNGDVTDSTGIGRARVASRGDVSLNVICLNITGESNDNLAVAA